MLFPVYPEHSETSNAVKFHSNIDVFLHHTLTLIPDTMSVNQPQENQWLLSVICAVMHP